ncbi:MAG: cobalt ECF transporter T component CbiQ [Dehalococcoidia bacterium]|nr:cobalt ECF transporter T component CbiQ [Dehalococcoidia bacterium]MCB9483751.1 cobalt ECF transporter T component CbiQ [Dehalococcoidia bacterium]
MAALTAVVERYAERDSVLHRADARAKVPAAIAYIFAITSTREGDWLTLLLLAVPVVLGAFVSKLGPWFVLRRTFLALPFVLAALPLLFTREGETIFTVPLVGWTASREGAEAVLTILARSWVAVGVAALLVSTTSIVDILRALRWFRVPGLLVATVFFAYRYFYVIGEEAQRMLRARDARSAQIPGYRAGRSIRWRAGVAGHMVGSLFVRSLERSERVYAAMQARGYHGEHRFLESPAFPASEGVVAVLLVLYGVSLQVIARLA